MCYGGVLNAARSSSIAIGLSRKCKSVFNKACSMQGCHAVINFEVKIVRFRTISLTVEADLQSKQSFLQGDFQCVTQD